MPGEDVCASYIYVDDPDPDEGGDTLVVLCELRPRHEGQHYGHIWYEDADETRWVQWGESGSPGTPVLDEWPEDLLH